MKFGIINLVNGIIILIILIPNVLYAIRFRKQKIINTSKIMNILEQTGRYASIVLMIIPLGVWEFGFLSANNFLIYFVGNVAILIAYFVIWIVYFKKPNMSLVLALAILPTIIFLISGITLRHWLLVASAIIFGIGHIYVTYQNNKITN